MNGSNHSLSKASSKDKKSANKDGDSSAFDDIDNSSNNVSINEADAEDFQVEQRFLPILDNLDRVNHEFLTEYLAKETDDYSKGLLETIDRLIQKESTEIHKSTMINKDLKKKIKAVELELKVQKKLQDSDFKELLEISKQRAEMNKFEHEKGSLDKNITETKKKINDVNMEIQMILTKIEANSAFFNELPDESKQILSKEISDSKVLSDFVKTKIFMKKFLIKSE